MVNKKVSESVRIPVIAHGGAGSYEDIYEVIQKTKISGVAIAGLLHYDACSLFSFKNLKVGNNHYLINKKKNKPLNNLIKIKKYLASKGVLVRL